MREFATAYFRNPGSLRVLPGLCRKVSASPPRAPVAPRAPEAPLAARTFDVFSMEVPPKKITFFSENVAPVRQSGSKSTPFTEETYKIAAKIDLLKRSHEVQRARNPGYTCK